MPEVPLWKLKIDGEEFPPPNEDEDIPVSKVPTPEESERVEFSRQAQDIERWYASKKKEYEEYSSSSEAVAAAKRAQVFLSNQDDIKAFLRSLRGTKGMEAWAILRVFFDSCKDSTITDQVVAALWRPATEWILHEKHREITTSELKDLWSEMDSFEAPPPVAEKATPERPVNPEYDENFRYLTGDDE